MNYAKDINDTCRGDNAAPGISLPDAANALSDMDIRMLAAIRHSLHTSVAAEVSSELAKTYCGFSVEFIDKMLIKYTEWPAILRRQVLRQTEVLREAAALHAADGVGDSEILTCAQTTIREVSACPGDTLPQLERSQQKIDTALQMLFPRLLADRKLRSGDALESINRLLREQIASIRDSERDFNTAQKARAERHAALTNCGVSVTPEKLLDYLSARFPGREMEITAFYEIPGGSSKSTVLIDVRGFEHEGVTPLVVRLDRLAGSTDTSVIDEVPTLQAMFAQGLPVPEVLFVEPDASKIGLAFIVVRKVDATLGGTMWQVDPQLCNADTARDLARILARLHTFDTARLGLRGALNSDPDVHPMRGLIDNIRGLWTQKKMEPDGTLEACLCWLEQNMPPAPARPSLIHADVAFHNVMVKDKKIAALLDWELSHLGDPIEDLSYGRQCIEQMIPWEEFLAEYRKHGGGDYSEETGRYYGIWRGVRNAVYTITSSHSFHTSANPDMRWGFFATYHRMILLEAADKVAEAGMRSI